jgi:hypothetical protein
LGNAKCVGVQGFAVRFRYTGRALEIYESRKREWYRCEQLPPVTLVLHCVGNLNEAGNVSTHNERWE